VFFYNLFGSVTAEKII